jgi:hypothetical protein
LSLQLSLELSKDNHTIDLWTYEGLCKITHMPAPQNFVTGIIDIWVLINEIFFYHYIPFTSTKFWWGGLLFLWTFKLYFAKFCFLSNHNLHDCVFCLHSWLFALMLHVIKWIFVFLWTFSHVFARCSLHKPSQLFNALVTF